MEAVTTLTREIQWRLPTGLHYPMPGIQLLTISLLPESRYFSSKVKDEGAFKNVTKYHYCRAGIRMRHNLCLLRGDEGAHAGGYCNLVRRGHAPVEGVVAMPET